jgi:hypothetical protein
MVITDMHTVSIEHAKAHLDELLDEAVHGESVAIDVGDDVFIRWTVERKMPAVKAAPAGWPVLGMLKGKVWMAPDFNDIPEGFEEYVK